MCARVDQLGDGHPIFYSLTRGIRTPYYWVYDPLRLVFENHGSLDPSKCGTVPSIKGDRLWYHPETEIFTETLPLGQPPTTIIWWSEILKEYNTLKHTPGMGM